MKQEYSSMPTKGLASTRKMLWRSLRSVLDLQAAIREEISGSVKQN